MLVQEHRRNDPDLQAVYFADDPSDREIRLVEVSGSVGNAWHVLPVRFVARPDRGVPYPCVIVLIGPEEWAAIWDARGPEAAGVLGDVAGPAPPDPLRG